MTDKRLYLTGARGFTGRHLGQQAIAQGYRVFESEIDLSDGAALRHSLAEFKPTHVVHLAAISSATLGDEMAYYQVNVVGTRTLLESVRAECPQVKQVLVASSAAVYGNVPGDNITESTPAFPAGPYGVSKLAAELVSTGFFSALPVAIVRPFNYTGVGHADSFVIPKLVAAFANKSSTVELGNIHVEREFNDVRFAANCYLQLLEKAGSGETYNLCTGRAIALTAVISKLESLTGHRPEIQVNPKFVRPNDAPRLRGDPSKLFSVVPERLEYSLEDTLQWMLASKA